MELLIFIAGHAGTSQAIHTFLVSLSLDSCILPLQLYASWLYGGKWGIFKLHLSHPSLPSCWTRSTESFAHFSVNQYWLMKSRSMLEEFCFIGRITNSDISAWFVWMVEKLSALKAQHLFCIMFVINLLS